MNAPVATMKPVVQERCGSPEVPQLGEIAKPAVLNDSVLDRCHPMQEAPAAVRHTEERRARGKVVVTV